MGEGERAISRPPLRGDGGTMKANTAKKKVDRRIAGKIAANHIIGAIICHPHQYHGHITAKRFAEIGAAMGLTVESL